MAKDMSIWSLSLLDSTARGINRIYRMKKNSGNAIPVFTMRIRGRNPRQLSKIIRVNLEKRKQKQKQKETHQGKEGTKGGGERKTMITVDLTFYRASLVAQGVKNPPEMWETWVWSLGWEDALEKGTTTHSSMGSSSVDSNSWKYMGETFQKVLNNKTWICCAGNYERSAYTVLGM